MGVQHQMRDVDSVLSGCLSLASGRLTVQKASGTRRAPSIRWKALAAPLSAESHCATVRCSYLTLGPRTRPSEELLEASSAILHPPQSGSRSFAAIQSLPPSGVTAAIAERKKASATRNEFMIRHHEDVGVWLFRCWERVAEISAAAATAEFIYKRAVLIEAHLPRIIVRLRLLLV